MKTRKFLALLLSALMLLSLAAMTGCGKGGDSYRLPIVCGETSMNDVCGVATYGVNYYNLGVKAGDMAADILLNGASPATTPVATDPSPALSVNDKVAGELNFTVPEALKAKAGGDSTVSVTRNDAALVSDGADFTVGILQLVQHVALDSANKGFVDELSVRMAEAGKTVTILDENAANDQSNCSTIATTFVGKNVDLIYAIATAASQAAASATETIPVLFNAVTDPVSAGLVASMDAPGKNVTGVSDINPVADQIDLIAELLGKTELNIGLLYTAGESNSVFQIDLARKECEVKGFKFTEKGLGDINDLEAAFVALKAAGVDAIYIPTDNTLANGAASIHSLNMGE